MPLMCEPLCHFGDRLYFTTFPHPPPLPDILNAIATEPGNQPRVRARLKAGQSATPVEDASYYYFTVEDKLVYMSFFQDWGPLNIAMVYKACILIHELLEDLDLSRHRLVLYSSNDPKRKANTALLMALYVMIVQRRAPWEAFHPIAELEFMPFRDAGRGPSDFSLNIQDCLWGVWKAMQNGLCDMNEFSVEDYEFHEKVENGDWNWLTPHFIALASPVDTYWVKKEKEAREKLQQQSAETAPTAKSTTLSGANLALQRKLPTPFLNCLDYFEKRNVRLVVRLNTALYDRSLFLDRGIDHMELYFDDGTNPTDEIVRTFIETVDKVIEAGGAVAVHCKAGLGRTGTLIGAYLIWKYGFTANEVIAFMRIVRPGSVVGPQQQYMYLKQLEWCKWAALDELQKVQLANAMPVPAFTAPATPPAETDDDSDAMQMTPPSILPIPISLPLVTPSKHVTNGTAKARKITPPGQPRKSPQAKRVASDSDSEEMDDVLPALGVAPITRPKVKVSRVGGKITSSESRPARVTRSTAGAAAIRKAGEATFPTRSPVKGSQQGPNKIPRLATTRTTAAAKAAVETPPTTRRPPPPPSPSPPPPSRLPTLSKRLAMNGNADVSTLKRPASVAANAWMKNNASAVVAPATKSGRPGLRSVRKRRSSFSAADVVA